MEIARLYQIAELYLKYLSVFLSWPVMVAAALLIFFCKFHSALDHLIRTLRIKSPTGYEIQSQQPGEIKDMDLPISNEVVNIGEKIIEDLEKKYKITKIEMEELRKKSAIEFRDSVIWKFRYLNLFFTPNTKNILGLFSLGALSRQTFEPAYSVIIPDHAQRNLCLQVLFENDMLREKDGPIEITPEGRLFLSFIGWKV